MYVWVVLQICVVTNALHTLCISMYYYDCLCICKDLTEGEINKSISQRKACTMKKTRHAMLFHIILKS